MGEETKRSGTDCGDSKVVDRVWEPRKAQQVTLYSNANVHIEIKKYLFPPLQRKMKGEPIYSQVHSLANRIKPTTLLLAWRNCGDTSSRWVSKRMHSCGFDVIRCHKLKTSSDVFDFSEHLRGVGNIPLDLVVVCF